MHRIGVGNRLIAMANRNPVQIVWFKRDLRVLDNAALSGASTLGPVLPLFIFEPELLLAQPDQSGRQWAFAIESLEQLRLDLAELGQPLVIRTGNAVEILDEIRQQFGVAALWSHQETGNSWTFARDRSVAVWARSHAIPWFEPRQHGVTRRLASRNGWARDWEKLMRADRADPPPGLPNLSIVDLGAMPTVRQLRIADDHCPARQRGGRREATALLDTFLTVRGRTYRRDMSSPATAFDACSRLSPHLAWGTLSMREAAQATQARISDLKRQHEPNSQLWHGAMTSFAGRLHWHCHFIQKLESEPRLEFESLHRAYRDVRPAEPDRDRLAAWSRGETGFPFVDACMRALIATGWLNFRMRAMLVSFASYQLWLPWRDTGLHLARVFTDYEPGIHWSQVQMQSGTTGINPLRIYNPVKQSIDQDPDATFIRAWVPEVAGVPNAFIHEPWRYDDFEAAVAGRYPRRIVDHIAAARTARDQVWAVRMTRQARHEANAIQDKHGSRKSGIPMTGQRRSMAHSGTSSTGAKTVRRATEKPAAKPAKKPSGQFEFDL